MSLRHIIPIVAVIILPAMIFAGPVHGDGDKDPQVVADEKEAVPVVSQVPGNTLFLKVGGGAAQTRVIFDWVDNPKTPQPLDGSTLVSSGYVSNLSITDWIYPIQNRSFIVIAGLGLNYSSTKIHYSGPEWRTIDNKKVNYAAFHPYAGIGYRSWFGKLGKYSITYFFHAGPGVGGAEITEVADLITFGGYEFQAGLSVQYTYSTRIMFGGGAEFGYRAYMGTEQELKYAFGDDTVDMDLSTGYLQFFATIGYEFKSR